MPSQIGYFDTLKSAAGKVFSYLASITLTGTDGKTITVTQDTSLDEAIAMSGKLTIPGAWTTPAFSAGDFTANGSMTWTVASGGVYTLAYNIVGKIMTVSYLIAGTVGGTPSTTLLIKIPAGKTATKLMSTVASVYEAAYVPARVKVVAGETNISLLSNMTGTANWAAGGMAVEGIITFEIN